MENYHIGYFDKLKILASFAVVLIHTTTGAATNSIATYKGWYLITAVRCFAYIAVPIFFMVSGYLLTNAEKTSSMSYVVKKRIPKLLVPLAFWSAMYIVYSFCKDGNFSFKNLFDKIALCIQKPINVSYWFMYVMIAIYLISPILCTGLKNLDKKGQIVIIAIIVILKLRMVIDVLFPTFADKYLQFEILDYYEIFGDNIASFIIGWYLGRIKRKIPFPILISSALAVFGTIFYGTVVRSVRDNVFYEGFVCQSGGFELLLAALIFLIAKQTKFPKCLDKISKKAASCTFAVYLSHNLLLFILSEFVSINSTAALLLYSLGVYVLCLIVAIVCSKVPVLSFLAVGQGKLTLKRE